MRPQTVISDHRFDRVIPEASNLSSATTTTTTTTMTRTSRAVDSAEIDQLRSSLRLVSDGLDDVRDRARAGLDAIDTLIATLDVDSLSGVTELFHRMEETLTTIERERNEALDARGTLSDELEAEKARLTKLWDAYKSQEEELRRSRRDEPILKERLADRERLVSELEDDLARYKAMESYKERYQGLLRDHERLRETYKGIESDLDQRNETIAMLESKVESFKSYEEDTRRVKDLERQLTEEKERLAKLYKVYEDTEAKLRDTEEESSRWRQWYDRHRQAFELVGDAAHYPVKTLDE